MFTAYEVRDGRLWRNVDFLSFAKRRIIQSIE